MTAPQNPQLVFRAEYLHNPSDSGRAGKRKAPPPQFCITIVLDFSCEDCNTQEKLKMFVLFVCFFLWEGGGGGGVDKVHYGLCESSEFTIFTWTIIDLFG